MEAGLKIPRTWTISVLFITPATQAGPGLGTKEQIFAGTE